jgi:hypothetical protein
MRWIRDASGRFPRRPHYTPDELEHVCADLRAELRTLRPSKVGLPLSTDDLGVLIEHRAADLDLFADLVDCDPDVEAVTDFVPGGAARVRIAARLANQPRSAARLRMTLAHELGHVVLHNFIWWFESGALDARQALALSPRCGPRRPPSDWMEWQANYAAGALLMPVPGLREHVGAVAATWERSSRGRALVRAVQRDFAVSAAAATVRLRQLGYLSERPAVVLRAPVPRL